MAIRVMLADDHAVVRDGLRMVLESQDDIEVVGDAADGRQAVEQAKALRPDIVLMDIAMPNLNGIEAAPHIREAVPRTQVVMLSMHATSEHVSRSLQAGAAGFVLKESAGKEVIEAVRTVQRGHRFLSPKVEDMVVEGYIRQAADSPEKTPLERLSGREREVLQLVAEGKSSAAIADTLALSPKTVETYRSRVMHKLGLGDLPSLVKFAIEHGIIPSG